MTREEFAILAKAMRSVYTHERFLPNKDAFDVWYGLLSDLPYEVASASIKRHMQISNKIITPADIREGVAALAEGNRMTANEAWALVSTALRRSAYYSREEYDKLPRTIQRAVGSADRLRQMAIDESYNESVQMSQFIKAYTAAEEMEKKQMLASPDIQKLIDGTLKMIGSE